MALKEILENVLSLTSINISKLNTIKSTANSRIKQKKDIDDDLSYANSILENQASSQDTDNNVQKILKVLALCASAKTNPSSAMKVLIGLMEFKDSTLSNPHDNEIYKQLITDASEYIRSQKQAVKLQSKAVDTDKKNDTKSLAPITAPATRNTAKPGPSQPQTNLLANLTSVLNKRKESAANPNAQPPTMKITAPQPLPGLNSSELDKALNKRKILNSQETAAKPTPAKLDATSTVTPKTIAPKQTSKPSVQQSTNEFIGVLSKQMEPFKKTTDNKSSQPYIAQVDNASEPLRNQLEDEKRKNDALQKDIKALKEAYRLQHDTVLLFHNNLLTEREKRKEIEIKLNALQDQTKVEEPIMRSISHDVIELKNKYEHALALDIFYDFIFHITYESLDEKTQSGRKKFIKALYEAYKGVNERILYGMPLEPSEDYKHMYRKADIEQLWDYIESASIETFQPKFNNPDFKTPAMKSANLKCKDFFFEVMNRTKNLDSGLAKLTAHPLAYLAKEYKHDIKVNAEKIAHEMIEGYINRMPVNESKPAPAVSGVTDAKNTSQTDVKPAAAEHKLFKPEQAATSTDNQNSAPSSNSYLSYLTAPYKWVMG